MERHFQVLDVGLTLCGPAPVVRPIAHAYRRFVTGDAAAAATRLEVQSPDLLLVNGREFPLLSGLGPVYQVYQRFLNVILDSVAGHAVLHASALLDGQGGVFVIAAPSGHGKTSLTLELARRGYRFLSDDYAPLELATREVHPYPRTVGILPGGDAPVPAPFLDAARRPELQRLLGKALVDVGDVLGESALARAPGALRHVLVLTGEQEPAKPESSRLELGCRADAAARIERRINAVRGVTVLRRSDRDDLTRWSLELRHEHRPGLEIARILDDDAVVFSEKIWDAKPDFSGSPEAAPLKRRRAAELLSRELLNRRGAGGLMARYQGDLLALLLDLGSALRDAGCWQLRPGPLDATADLIEELVT